MFESVYWGYVTGCICSFSAKGRHRYTSFLTTTRHEMSGYPGNFGNYGYSRNKLLEQAIAMRLSLLISVHWSVG